MARDPDQPLCLECDEPAVALMVVGSLGTQDELCTAHLQARKRIYELDLTTFQIVSVVHTPERIEEQYAQVVGELRTSERATSETLTLLEAANSRVARLELEQERLSRRVAAEQSKAQNATDELLELRELVMAYRSKLPELKLLRLIATNALAFLEEHDTLVGLLGEPHASNFRADLHRWAAIDQGQPIEQGLERESTAEGSPAAGEGWAVVEGSEPDPDPERWEREP